LEKKMNERRRSTRRTNYLRGRLYFHGDGRNSLPCRIVDASYEGARVIVDSPISVPDEVELYIPKKKRIALARVRWRHGEKIGLALSAISRRDV
jgi:PilZ domain